MLNATLRLFASQMLVWCFLATIAVADPPSERDEQIAALEKKLAELQAQLKLLKQPIPKKRTFAEEVLPSDLVEKLHWRSIGPVTTDVRIKAMAVVESDPSTFWLVTAHGGLLKTTNGGSSFEIQFDRDKTNSIHAIAVAPSNRDVVFIGTGNGVYKSIDGGKTWANMGLRSAHRFGSLVIHPKNADVVYVSALGSSDDRGGTRGLFKTVDGGQRWDNLLPDLGTDSVVLDLAMNPSQPDTLIAVSAKKTAASSESLEITNSNLWRSTDAGMNWSQLTDGLPKSNSGKVSVAWSRKSPKTMFALIAQEKPTAINVETLYLFKSIDAGEHWNQLSSIQSTKSPGNRIEIDHADEQIIDVIGTHRFRSIDGGKTFALAKMPTSLSAEMKSLWINPYDSKHLILGTETGLWISRQSGERWERISISQPRGEFFHVAVDTQQPYRIYAAQNGNKPNRQSLPEELGTSSRELSSSNGSDQYVTRVDPHDDELIYAYGPAGQLLRRDRRTDTIAFLRPNLGTESQRRPPFLVSSHQSATFYVAGKQVFKSLKRGEDLQQVSPELARMKNGFATALSESPRNANVLWVGTNDGALWFTKDGCKSWTNVTEKLPKNGTSHSRWVSSIEASRWVEGRAYIVFDNQHYYGDDPEVYVTEDFGNSWKSLSPSLPDGATLVLREDIVHRDLIYLGTNSGIYASINRGQAWTKINSSRGLPTVAVQDLAQPINTNELVVATLGRSLWVLDISTLRKHKISAP